MDIRPENRCGGRGTLLIAVRIIAAMLLDTELMIAEDRMKIRLHKSVFLELLTAIWAGIIPEIDQGRLLSQ